MKGIAKQCQAGQIITCLKEASGLFDMIAGDALSPLLRACFLAPN